MALMRIRAELARSHEYPEGSSRHGYTFVLPLGDGGRLDAEEFGRNREVCTIRRFWAGEGDEVGHVERSRGGRFGFSYRADGEVEPIHRLADHVFRVGEYVSVREHDGQTYTFKIVDVRPAPGLAASRA